ncbi:MAG: hypothetical protein ACREQ7_02390 [Candidatus Binatia bacterium]
MANLLSSEKSIRRLAILTLVYLIPSFQAMLPVDDPDIWWHLRAGQWILQQGSVPTEDPFSAYGSGKPWIAYSWLFEVLVYALYDQWGLMALLLLAVLMSLLIALVVHLLIRRGELPFLPEMTVLALALASMKPMISPRPWLFSILFFAAELLVLFEARRTGRVAGLLILPPLFVLWANLHIQFVYGLAALGLFFFEAVVDWRLRKQAELGSSDLPVGRVFMIAMACVCATLVNPYHYHLLSPIWEYSVNTGAFQNIQELHPLFFRSPADWFVLALVLGAAYTLGWQRGLLVFPTLLLIMGSFLGFRARRDAWILALASATILSQYRSVPLLSDPFRIAKMQSVAVAVTITLALYLIGQHRQLSQHDLEMAVEKKFPVKAVSFVKAGRYPGPIYNSLDWGGYLIWGLPGLPVSMDGRTNLHGDQRLARSIATWSGHAGWESDPELAQAKLVIASQTRPLASLLRRDSRFKLVYEDATALVFASNNAAP